MKYLSMPGTDLSASQVVMGCMRIAPLTARETEALIRGALEQGINFFDHADVYGKGGSEERFAQALAGSPSLRDGMILQSKCGIRDGYFDFSKEHIIASCEGSLRRLGVDHLDIYLLHRPDLLMEPEEVAEAFDALHRAGKARYFGVSNHTPAQIELLQRVVRQKLVVNQIQLSITHTPIFDHSIAANMAIDQSIDRAGSLYEYARLNNITLQAWSPFRKGFFTDSFLTDRENCAKLNAEIDRLAEQYGVTPSAIAVAWLARIPGGVQIIMGTTKPGRYADSCPGIDITLTRKEWYTLYTAAGKILP